MSVGFEKGNNSKMKKRIVATAEKTHFEDKVLYRPSNVVAIISRVLSDFEGLEHCAVGLEKGKDDDLLLRVGERKYVIAGKHYEMFI